LAGLFRHAGGGVVAGLGGAALFQRAELGLFFGSFLRLGAVEGALVAHALGVKGLAGGDILGLLDLAEEIVDVKFGLAGPAGLGGHAFALTVGNATEMGDEAQL